MVAYLATKVMGLPYLQRQRPFFGWIAGCMFFSCLLLAQTAHAQFLWVRDYYDFEKKFAKQAYRTSLLTGKKQGPFYGYYPNGVLQSAGEYDADKQTGLWHYYFTSGTQKAEGHYKAGEKNGLWSYFYENGNISQKGHVRNGKREDLWQFYYENGAVKSEGAMKDDQPSGLWKYYNEDASPKGQTLFAGLHGMHEEYYPDGKLKMRGLLRDGVSDSTWNYYYPNGQLKATGIERKGLKYGPWTFYYENGALQSEGRFEANQEHGTWRYYHPNGQVSSEGNLLAGKKDGNWNLYYESGKFMGEGKFTQGEGLYREYYDDGKLKTEGRIRDGNYEGPWKFYFNDGNLEGECAYANGEGNYIGYYPDGTRKISGTLKNGQKTGIWRLYDPDGSLNGLYKTYFDRPEPLQPEPAKVVKADSLPAVKRKRKRGQVALIMPGRRSHFFYPRINEPKGIVVLTNPAALIVNQLPVAVEYYFDQRLGYEIGVIGSKTPLLSVQNEDVRNTFQTLYQRGAAAYIRQKLYGSYHRFGSTYFAQEVRYTFNAYQASHRYLDEDTVYHTVINKGTEQKVEFSLLIGKRFMKNTNQDHTFLLDVYAGAGCGYRHVVLPDTDANFNNLSRNPFCYAIRAGFMLGYFF